MTLQARPGLAALSAEELAEFAEFEEWKRNKARMAAQAAPAAQLLDADPDDAPEDAADGDDTAAAPLVKGETKTALRSKLHRGHFAFMRCYVEGLDIQSSWDHYMTLHGVVTDVRAVRSAVKQLRVDLAAAARRFARPGMARLLRFDVKAIAHVAPKALPTLEAFAMEHGLEDFPMADQLREYTEQHGSATQRQSAHARMLAKQLAALRWLEGLAAEKPAANDAVAAWLIPELATPIEAAGILSLHQLAERINGMGLGWASSIKAIGAGKAARVVSWLREVADDTGLTIGAHVDTPRRQMTAATLATVVAPASAVVPIDKFIVPPALSGQHGQYRGPADKCGISADTDFAALLEFIRAKPALAPEEVAARKAKWLRAHPGEPLPAGPLAWLEYLSGTAESYLAEIYRFTLWAILQRGKAVSSINFSDAAAYRDFLADPQPFERWCNQARGRERYGPAWRPFSGKLGAVAAARAITILGSFYAFLYSKGYMTNNPFHGLAKPRAVATTQDTERNLTSSQWRHIKDVLDALPATSANLRLRFALPCMYATGLRRAEIVSAKVSDVRWVSFPPDEEDPETVEGWVLVVIGKRNTLRAVPLPQLVVDDLSAYLASRGLSPDLRALDNQNAYLLGHAVDLATRAPWAKTNNVTVDPHAGIGAQTFYDQLTAFFKRCAQQLGSSDPASAAQLERASTHWLRHAKISHSLAAGTQLDVERQTVGHQSLSTTSIYAHTEGKKMLRGSERFFQSSGVQQR